MAVASGKTQADAYRASFNAGKMLNATIYSNASRLMADSKISARVAELREPIAKAAQMTLESHLEALGELRNAAVEEKQLSAAISAEVARGKASGLYAPKVLSNNLTIILSEKDARL